MQHKEQDPEDDDSECDQLLDAERDRISGVRNSLFGNSGYTKLGNRPVHAIKTEAKRGKDRALSLLQVLSVSMDTNEVENAAEQLRRQLNTRPYGNAPHAGKKCRRLGKMRAFMNELKIIDS